MFPSESLISTETLSIFLGTSLFRICNRELVIVGFVIRKALQGFKFSGFNEVIEGIEDVIFIVSREFLHLREVRNMARHKYVSSTESYLMNQVEGLQSDIDKYLPF